MSWARKSKYNARPVTVDGIRFASTAEGRRFQELKLLAKAGRLFNLELQPAFPLLGVDGSKVCTYKADFRYRLDGVDTVEDVKGVPTPVYRLKKKFFLSQYRGFKFVESGSCQGVCRKRQKTT